jgi:hypothetical protein
MPEPTPASIMTFASSKELGRWLKVNHAIESELWVKIFKKKTGTPSVTWDDVVVEAGSMASRSQLMTKLIFSVLLPEKREVTGLKGTQSMLNV